MNLLFFRLIKISLKKGRKTASMRGALLQTFSVPFSVDTSINRKYMRSFSYHLIFIVFQQRKQSFLLFQTQGFWVHCIFSLITLDMPLRLF